MEKPNRKLSRVHSLVSLCLSLVILVCSVANAGTIELPSALKVIEAEAFYGDKSIDEIEIPYGTKTIGQRAFANSSVKKVLLPSTITSIADDAFLGCDEVIGYGPGNTYAEHFFTSHALPYDSGTSSTGSFAFTLSGNNYIITDYTGTDRVVYIPSTYNGKNVTKIDNKAFYNNSDIIQVYIPETVTEIGSYAFYNCTSLKEISLPSSLATVGYRAFNGTKVLSYALIPGSAKGASTDIFGHSGIRKVDLEEGIETITGYEFCYCTNLNEVNLPSTLKTIGERGFVGCTSLETIYIPESVTSISNNAFLNCSNLKKFKCPKYSYAWNWAIQNGFSSILVAQGEVEKVYVTSLTMSIPSDSFALGSSLTPSITVAPNNADNKKVIWRKQSGDAGVHINETTGVITATDSGSITFYAEAADGSGVKSNSNTVYVIPAAIPTLKVDKAGGKHVVLSWNSVAGANYYNLRYKKSSTSAWYTTAVFDKFTNTYELKIDSDTDYDVCIRARGSSSSNFTEYSTPIKVRSVTVGAPYAIKKSVTDNSVTITLEAGENTSFYEINYYTWYDKGEAFDEYVTIDGGVTQYTIDGLEAGTTYAIDVEATGYDGYPKVGNSYSGSIRATTSGEGADTKPTAPSSVSASAVNSTSIKVSWDKSSDASGYYVYWGTGSLSNASSNKITSNSTTTYTITGLQPGTTYTIWVSSYKSSNGNQSGKKTTKATTDTTDVGQVTGVKQTGYTNTSISLSWTKISSATGYRVYWRDVTNTSGGWDFKDITSNTNSATINSGISSNRYYDVCVAAMNGTKQSTASESVVMKTTSNTTPTPAPTATPVPVVTPKPTEGTDWTFDDDTLTPNPSHDPVVIDWGDGWNTPTPTAAPAQTVEPVPAKPTNLYAEFINGSIYVEWDQNDRSNLAGWWVYYQTNNTFNGSTYKHAKLVDVGDEWIEINNIDADNTTYYIWITAHNQTGGESSLAGPIMVTAAKPTSTPAPELSFIVKKGSTTLIEAGTTNSGTFVCDPTAGNGATATFNISSNYDWSVSSSASDWMTVEKANSTTAVVTLKNIEPGKAYSSVLSFKVNGKTYPVTITLTTPAVQVNSKPELSIMLNGTLYTDERNENTGLVVSAGSSESLWPSVSFSGQMNSLEVAIFDDGGYEIPVISYNDYEAGNRSGKKGNYVATGDFNQVTNPYVPGFFFPESMTAGRYWLTAIAINSTGRTEVQIAFTVKTKTIITVNPDATLMERFEKVKKALPSGKYWNHHTDSAGNLLSNTEEVIITNINGDKMKTWISTEGCPSNHHSWEYYAGGFTSENFAKSTCNAFTKNTVTSIGEAQCIGFANTVAWAISGKDPIATSWSNDIKELEKIQPGDMLWVSSSSTYGHKGVVLKVVDNVIYYADANGFSYGKCRISWNNQITMAELKGEEGTHRFRYIKHFKDYSK